MTKKYIISEEELIKFGRTCAGWPVMKEEPGTRAIMKDFLNSKKPIEIADIEDAIGSAIEGNTDVYADEVWFLPEENFAKTIKDAIQNIKDKGIELGG